MKKIAWINLLIIAALVASCAPNSATTGVTATDTPGLPTPQVNVTDAPDAVSALDAYLAALEIEDYPQMYSLLTAESRAAISLEDFTKRHKDAFNEMGMQGVEYNIRSTLTNPATAETAFQITYKTAIIGDLSRDLVAQFKLEEGGWKLSWNEGLILPELNGGNRLAMDYKIPARGDIYDRNGKAIASQDKIVAIGIVPGYIDAENEGNLVSLLARATGKSAADIVASYVNAAPDWYIPVGQASAKELGGLYGALASYPAVRFSEYESRYYQGSGIAPHAAGYVIVVPGERLEQYKRQGYSGAERIGALGVEAAAESYLSGKHGGTLYLLGPDGKVIQPLAKADSSPAQSVSMTIDSNLQKYTQQAIDGFGGAAVVIERDTGRILAMASSPKFDPNLFDPNNPNISELNNLAPGALLNRATQGEYPLGSVFKIITMAAGLESGIFTAESTYDCQYEWTELTDMVRHDWTWQHCQDEMRESEDGTCTTRPSGVLTLPQALMRSCNPWFWHIGKTLYDSGRTTAVTDMARGFGLGAPTGIEIAESAGNISDPTEVVQAVNESIGQDPVLVTPLQVARFVAAVGNGGTLYRPQIIEKVTDVNGNATQTFKPEAISTLPVKPENLKLIQDAMREVIVNPRGTAHYRLGGMRIPIFGKTGTAETSAGIPHAWFAGYTNFNNPDMPDIAVAVVIEYQGEGSQWAAPVFKRIVETYYYGKPQSLYPWESAFGVTRTPTPLGGADTPTPEP